MGVGFNVYRHPAGAFDNRAHIATIPHRRPLSPAWVHDFPATQVRLLVVNLLHWYWSQAGLCHSV